jgi:opacity protein-like surface antigen
MNPTTHLGKIVGAAVVLGCITSRATGWKDNLYIHTDIGPSFIQDATTHVRGFSVGSPFEGKGRFEADPGIRGDLSLGYNLNKSWAVELESGAIWNPGPSSVDEFYQIPVLLKGLYQVNLNDSWNLYCGAGAGAVVSINQTLIFEPGLFHTPFRVEDTDTALGYEAEAGIKYVPAPHLEIGLGYKFLGVDGYNYHFQGETLISNVRMDELFNHTALLSLTWKF